MDTPNNTNPAILKSMLDNLPKDTGVRMGNISIDNRTSDSIDYELLLGTTLKALGGSYYTNNSIPRGALFMGTYIPGKDLLDDPRVTIVISRSSDNLDITINDISVDYEKNSYYVSTVTPNYEDITIIIDAKY